MKLPIKCFSYLSVRTLPIIRSGGRFRRDQRQMEEEEEMWFNEEDDFTEEIDSYNNVMKCNYSIL